MSTIELISGAIEQVGVTPVALGFLLALWAILRAGKGKVSAQFTKEQLEALKGAVVLLVDDSVTIQKVIELLFMDASVRLSCATNGESAMVLLEKQKFDLVITDVHMPTRNGYEVCEYAKRLNPKIPVLLLVGTFESFSEGLYKRCGADEVLKKPFNSADLMRITSRLLQQEGDEHVERDRDRHAPEMEMRETEMSDTAEQLVPKITSFEEKTLFGGVKVKYYFYGETYASRGEAEQARREVVERRRNSASYDEESLRRKQEDLREKEQEDLREKEEAYRELQAQYEIYDSAPEYVSIAVASEPIRDQKDVWFGLFGKRDTGLAAIVDLESLQQGIYEKCRELSLAGYEVISIVPATSGLGAYNSPGAGGAGFAFTSGAIITAKRCSSDTTATEVLSMNKRVASS